MQNVKTYFEQQPLLFDGAMGTYLASLLHRSPEKCEELNLTAPETVAEAHRQYLAAGCQAIKTNTFGANRLNFGDSCGAVLAAGYGLAREAAGDKALVFADIGPLVGLEGAKLEAEYRFLVDAFLEQGASCFLFETFGGDEGLEATLQYLRPKADYVILSFAAAPDGFTRQGRSVRELLQHWGQSPLVDALGLNCVSGARHMGELVKALGPVGKPLAAMPNAGYPTVLGGRTVYEGSADYFAAQLLRLRDEGAAILGGCCGTTPAHMAAVNALLGAEPKPLPLTAKAPDPQPEPQMPQENPFWEALCDPAQKPFAVELDPPEAADVTKFMAGAKALRDSGAAIVTIADCPIARARMDSSILACKIRRELQMQALPHMTCRDRNLNATKALLLGLCAEDVHNVLVVTGDPIPSASRDEVKSVYNFNSRMLARYITGLGETLPTPFRVFGALNLNARNFKVQLDLARKKQENGVSGFLTQPVLTAQALENLQLARETLDGKILGGIIPIVSHRNAQFMNAEVSGITVDDRIVAMYEGADRAAGEDLAVRISAAVAKEIAPYIDGYYLITPFGRTGLMARIMEEIRKG